jgi:large subunit ribosomal protein L9
MKVVLSRDVKDLGQAGQITEVADGYARNYLFPRRLALPATPSVLKQAEERAKADARRLAGEERLAQQLASKIGNLTLVIHPKVGEQGRLYGSVTSADLAQALERQLGQHFDKRKIELEEPIRMIGEYTVPLRLSRTVTATLTVQIERQ